MTPKSVEAVITFTRFPILSEISVAIESPDFLLEPMSSSYSLNNRTQPRAVEKAFLIKVVHLSVVLTFYHHVIYHDSFQHLPLIAPEAGVCIHNSATQGTRTFIQLWRYLSPGYWTC